MWCSSVTDMCQRWKIQNIGYALRAGLSVLFVFLGFWHISFSSCPWACGAKFVLLCIERKLMRLVVNGCFLFSEVVFSARNDLLYYRTRVPLVHFWPPSGPYSVLKKIVITDGIDVYEKDISCCVCACYVCACKQACCSQHLVSCLKDLWTSDLVNCVSVSKKLCTSEVVWLLCSLQSPFGGEDFASTPVLC